MSDLSRMLKKIFPRTLSQLLPAEAESLCAEFEKDWGIDQMHFFPMFLRQSRRQKSLVEAADYEFLFYSLCENPLTGQKLNLPFQLNQNLRILHLQEAAPVLGKESGLYALWSSQGRFFELKLNSLQAGILDRLREDQVLIETELTPEEVPVLRELVSQKIVLVGPQVN